MKHVSRLRTFPKDRLPTLFLNGVLCRIMPHAVHGKIWKGDATQESHGWGASACGRRVPSSATSCERARASGHVDGRASDFVWESPHATFPSVGLQGSRVLPLDDETTFAGVLTPAKTKRLLGSGGAGRVLDARGVGVAQARHGHRRMPPFFYTRPCGPHPDPPRTAGITSMDDPRNYF